MKIKALEIINWRSIKNVKIDFQDIMFFLGQNNHGKSNVLSALLFFFNKVTPTKLDFNNVGENLFVEVTFDKLDDFDKNQFSKYVTSEGTIKVKKVCDTDENVSYHGYIQSPDIEWLKPDKISEYIKRENHKDLPIFPYLPPSGRVTIDLFKDAQLRYIQDHIEELHFSFILETTNFQGAVGKGIMGDVFYIPSVKDAQDELGVRGNALFNQLYTRVIEKISSVNPQYNEAKQKLSDLSGLLNKTKDDGSLNNERPRELTALEERLENELKSWNTTIEVEIKPPKIDDIFRLNAEVWLDDGVKTDITRKGHGLQRALFWALLKTYANTLEQERNIQPVDDAPIRGTSDSSFFIFEEPELYLHPHAQRELYDTLKELSRLSNNQVILCTHSNLFVDLNFHKSICIVKKDSLEEGTKCLQCTTDFLNADEKKLFNLVYWINPDRSELFFAKKIILVEGSTDKTIIPYLAKKIGVFRYDYSLIECGGKDSLPNYIKMLNEFSLKYIVVFDRDHQRYKTEEQKNSSNASSQRIIDSIDDANGSHIVLDNDVEEEIGILEKSDKSKPYLALLKVDNAAFRVSPSFKRKIEVIYH